MADLESLTNQAAALDLNLQATRKHPRDKSEEQLLPINSDVHLWWLEFVPPDLEQIFKVTNNRVR